MSETRGRPMDVSRSEAEKFALRRINECAPDFALNHPQIVEDLRTMTVEDVAKKYNVEELFSVTLQIAKGIVNRAIRIILTPEEIKELYGPRLIKLHREVGLNSFANGLSIFQGWYTFYISIKLVDDKCFIIKCSIYYITY